MKEIQTIRKLKMTLPQYIESTQERKTMLEARLEEQKRAEERNQLRKKFYDRLSIDILNTHREPVELQPGEAEKYYRNLYKMQQDNIPTPTFNKWLKKLRKHTRKIATPRPLYQDNIEQEIEQALQKSSALESTWRRRHPHIHIQDPKGRKNLPN